MIHVTRLHCEMPYFSMVGTADGLTPQILNVLRTHPQALVASNSRRMADDFTVALGEHAWFLPSTYPLADRREWKPDPTYDDVVCFGRVFSLKNILAQAVASMRFSQDRGRPLRFHVNDFADHGDRSILESLKILFAPLNQLCIHGWMLKAKLYDFLSTMTVGLQVSFSEASNVMTMDYASVGIPMVVSREIKWVHPCSIAYPTDTYDIAERMQQAVSDPHTEFLISQNRNGLQRHNDECFSKWENFLAEYPAVRPIVLFLYHVTPNGQETGISNAATNDAALLKANGITADAVATDFSRGNVMSAMRARPYTHVIYEASFQNLLYI